MAEEKKSSPKKMTKAQLQKDRKTLQEIAGRMEGEEFRTARKALVMAENSLPILK